MKLARLYFRDIRTFRDNLQIADLQQHRQCSILFRTDLPFPLKTARTYCRLFLQRERGFSRMREDRPLQLHRAMPSDIDIALPHCLHLYADPEKAVRRNYLRDPHSQYHHSVLVQYSLFRKDVLVPECFPFQFPECRCIKGF